MRLVAENLCIDRGGRRIVDRLSFVASAGEAVVLTGPNGAGKTTLIRAIAGFLPLAGGRVRLDGLLGGDGGRDDSEGLAEHCHFIGHRDGIKGAMTVAENAAFFARYLSGFSSPLSPEASLRLDVGEVALQAGGLPSARRAGGGATSPTTASWSPPPPLRGTSPARGEEKQALTRLGLGALADVPAAWLSAGQRRRLGLSRLLLAKRPLWLLDEPTVSLDAAAVATLAGIVAEHLAAGGIVVAATHIPLGLDGAREFKLGLPAADPGAEDAA